MTTDIKHKIKTCNCNKPSCPVCEWGASICSVCGKAEAELDQPCVSRAKVCPDCDKEVDGDEFILELSGGDVFYHLECAKKSGLYTPSLGYVVNYDYPPRHTPGEHVQTAEEAEEIRAIRIKDGYVNVRIDPVVA